MCVVAVSFSKKQYRQKDCVHNVILWNPFILVIWSVPTERWHLPYDSNRDVIKQMGAATDQAFVYIYMSTRPVTVCTLAGLTSYDDNEMSGREKWHLDIIILLTIVVAGSKTTDACWVLNYLHKVGENNRMEVSNRTPTGEFESRPEGMSTVHREISMYQCWNTLATGVSPLLIRYSLPSNFG